jgi:hypothetical protein
MHRAFVAFLFGFVLMTMASRAGAQDAEALIAKGIELREQKKDEEALGLFKQAYAKTPTPRARAQIALAEQALGLWILAESDLVAALGVEGDAWITKNRVALEGALATIRRHVGSLEVRGVAEGDVYLDGIRLGSGPGPYRVEAGKRTLEVRAKGFHSTTRAVEIPANGVARETVTLVAASAEEPKTPPSANDGRPTPGTKDKETSDDPGKGQRLLGWAFVGTGAALAVTGVVGLLIRKGIVDDYNERCPGLGVAQPADCGEKADSASTWLTVSIVMLVAGGAVGLGGGALVLTAPSAHEKTAVWCGPLGCAGTF